MKGLMPTHPRGVLPFVKMHGIGNDYVYIDADHHQIADPPTLARAMSDRHFGVGSDGIILVSSEPGAQADIRMSMYNADGSFSENCGNGLRCVAKFAFERGKVQHRCFRIASGDGVYAAEVFLQDRQAESSDATARVAEVALDMAAPQLAADQIPSTLTGELVLEQPFEFGGQKLCGTLVNIGNPHFVTFVSDLEQAPVQQLGSLIEHSPLFPQGINVEFVQLITPERVKQRTWERGSGETLACGTGACAVAVAGVLSKRTGHKLCVELLGGELNITYDHAAEQLIMRGGAHEVFSGVWPL